MRDITIGVEGSQAVISVGEEELKLTIEEALELSEGMWVMAAMYRTAKDVIDLQRQESEGSRE